VTAAVRRAKRGACRRWVSSHELARLALRRRKKKKGTVNRFAEVRGGRRAASQVSGYDTNPCRLAVRRRHKGTRNKFQLNRTVMDASGHNAIEINEWSTFRAEFGKLYRLHRADRRAGVVNHVYDCRSSLQGVGFLLRGSYLSKIVRVAAPQKRRGSHRRIDYVGPNGNRWLLALDPDGGRVFVRHEPIFRLVGKWPTLRSEPFLLQPAAD
jgi:hypothetical protein